MSKAIPFMPMEPVLEESPFNDDDYLFQVKWDGVRLIADKSSEGIELWNRKGRQRTALYPEIVEALQALPVRDCVFDGEVISFGDDGRPNFRSVLRRDLAKSPRLQIAVCYVVFDCLRAEGQWLFDAPIETRQSWIDKWLNGSGVVQPCSTFQDGINLFRRMEALGMEGIVAKRRGSLYHPGRKLPIWKKVKCWQTLTVQASGVNWREGRPASVIVVDRSNPGHSLASVSSGLSQTDWRKVLTYATAALTGQSGCTPLSAPLLMDVRFLEWTDDGHLRAPVVERVHDPSAFP